jgi:hypothetical protein
VAIANKVLVRLVPDGSERTNDLHVGVAVPR